MTLLNDRYESRSLMPLEEMKKLIAGQVVPIPETELVAIGSARGRVIATDVKAPINLPQFDNSAVDGYAVRHADLLENQETALNLSGRVTAGCSATVPIEAGQAVRIFTGAPMPASADTVFMQEDVRIEDNKVVVSSGLKLGANRRLAGEDLSVGAVAFPAGRVLDARHVALAAALGLTELTVRRRVRVAVFSTGNEVIEPGSHGGPATIFDANRHMVVDLLNRLGCIVRDLGILRDDATTLADTISAAAMDHDLVLTSGGVSIGDADHVRTAIEGVGKLLFWRVAIKPGRSIALGLITGKFGSSAVFVGLPGNPVAVFVTFVQVVRPLLFRLLGALPPKLMLMPVTAAFAYRKKKNLREYVRVTLKRRVDGEYEAIKHPQDGSAILTSLTETDGLLELPEDMMSMSPGERVGFLSYADLMS